METSTNEIFNQDLVINTNNDDLPNPSEITQIIYLNATIDPGNVEVIRMDKNMFEYRVPAFRANAVVHIPAIKNKDSFKVGWIQACEQMNITHQYKNSGISSWILPDLLNNKLEMISDANEGSFPWYGSGDQTCTVHGPTQSLKRCKVSMIDGLRSKISMVPPSRTRTGTLSRIHRKQRFLVWLVLMVESEQKFRRFWVLKTIDWGITMAIRVGRCKESCVKMLRSTGPRILDVNVKIPHNCFDGPTANLSQVLVWIDYDRQMNQEEPDGETGEELAESCKTLAVGIVG